MRQHITSTIDCQEMVIGDNYIGVPILWDMFKKEAIDFMLEKVTKKAASWKGKLLSLVGREVLVKAEI